MLIVVCCPNRTIFVPARQSQQTSALSAPERQTCQQAGLPRYTVGQCRPALPAETRFFELRATALIPFRCPASCCSGVYVKDEKRCTRLIDISFLPTVWRAPSAYPTSWNPTTKTSVHNACLHQYTSVQQGISQSPPSSINQSRQLTTFPTLRTFLHSATPPPPPSAGNCQNRILSS